MSRNPMPEGRRRETFNRDGWTCQAGAYGWLSIERCCTRLVAHHRMSRGMGGSPNPKIHALENLVTLCDLHHREVHDYPARAYDCGLMVRR